MLLYVFYICKKTFFINAFACYIQKCKLTPFNLPHPVCLYLVPFLRYSASTNGLILKPGVGVFQDHIRLFIGLPL